MPNLNQMPERKCRKVTWPTGPPCLLFAFFLAPLRSVPAARPWRPARPGAARDFRQWAEELAERWAEAQNLCAAHTATLTAGRNQGASIHDRLIKALDKVSRKLKAHERKYG